VFVKSRDAILEGLEGLEGLGSALHQMTVEARRMRGMELLSQGVDKETPKSNTLARSHNWRRHDEGHLGDVLRSACMRN
jgi:hypothetical protein